MYFQQESLSALNRIKLDRLAGGQEVLDLSMINPDIQPPRCLLDRFLQASINPANHRYGVSRGIRRLREGFAQRYQIRFGVSLDSETEICASLGTKDAVFHALSCLARGGYAGEVLLGAPSYPAHVWAVQSANLALSFFQLRPDWQQMLQEIEQKIARGRVRIVLLNFPNNPTGISVPAAFMEKLRALASQHGVFVLNDFVYAEMCFSGQPAASILAGQQGLRHVAETQSLSKSFSVPGWRVGAIAGDSDLIAQISESKSRLDYGIFLPLQIAAADVLTSKEDLIGPAVSEYQRRCLVCLRGLERLGFELSAPQAGASVWARLPESLRGSIGQDAGAAFCHGLALASGVVCMPGSSFGSEFGDYLRLAMVQPPERLRAVLEGIEEYLKGGEQCSRLVA